MISKLGVNYVWGLVNFTAGVAGGAFVAGLLAGFSTSLTFTLGMLVAPLFGKLTAPLRGRLKTWWAKRQRARIVSKERQSFKCEQFRQRRAAGLKGHRGVAA